MSASLSYRPDPNPPAPIADLIIQEASALSRVAHHWCEPLCFLRSPEGWLVGCSKVSLPVYTTPDGTTIVVEPRDDVFMMAQEVEMQLRCISGWAKAYKLGWAIQFEGKPVGHVSRAGIYSDDLQSFLADMNLAAETPRDPEALKSRVLEIRERHARRRG